MQIIVNILGRIAALGTALALYPIFIYSSRHLFRWIEEFALRVGWRETGAGFFALLSTCFYGVAMTLLCILLIVSAFAPNPPEKKAN